MALLSSVNIVYLRVAFLCFLSYACLKDVSMILDNASFLVLTHAMQLPALNLAATSAQLGLFAVIFGLMALHDLIPLLETNRMYFQSIVPTRLLFFFVIAGMSYFLETNFYFHNNAVFIYAFVEVWMNFLIFSAIREEKNEDFKQGHRVTGATEDAAYDEDRLSAEELEDTVEIDGFEGE
ncbi:LAMI_0G15742g1_1 [Lachancea mirantina]|uniref:LAMI_0G15742g1_1 n=1 Tax=Lachancea mirantina TaxID=1230905 RepID=A0A1G4KCT9_9SACH|nr:LAMI_0G15742g1_1 [Lachancea mirantina]